MSTLWHVSRLRRTRIDIQATSNDEAYLIKLRQIRVSFVSLHTVRLYGISVNRLCGISSIRVVNSSPVVICNVCAQRHCSEPRHWASRALMFWHRVTERQVLWCFDIASLSFKSSDFSDIAWRHRSESCVFGRYVTLYKEVYTWHSSVKLRYTLVIDKQN